MSDDISWGQAVAKIATTIRQHEAESVALKRQHEQDNTYIWTQQRTIARLKAEVARLQAQINSQIDIRG